MKCGEILLVNYPFTDQSASKVRPVLVVSSDPFNVGDDIVIVPISSVSHPHDPFAYEIPRSSTYFASTGLRFDSVVKWTKPLTIAKSIVTRRLGALHADPLADLRAKIRSLFE